MYQNVKTIDIDYLEYQERVHKNVKSIVLD